MRIKSLLLGSAAALVAVSGARAADAIIAEPEPVEYVRVCDVYGTGFFYIPGTETCLKISGWVRYEIRDDETVDGWDKNSQIMLDFDARSDTEWGLLRGWIRMEPAGDNLIGTSDFGVTVDHAVIQLGGLFMGWNDSLFVSSSTILGSPLGNYGTHSMNGLSYGFQQRQHVGYQFTGGNGLYGAIALEHDPVAVGTPDDDYIPDVVGKLAWATGWGGIYGVVGYDEDSDGFGVRVGAQFDMPNAPGSSLRVYGFYVSEEDVDYSPATDAEWSAAASYFHRFTPTFGASAGVHHINFHETVADDSDTLAEVYAIWTPVPGFSVQAEVNHEFSEEVTGARLRFERSF